MAEADFSVDVLVIGAGIAGASAGCEIADFASVLLVERESQPGYHATGRSAALYTEAYGNELIRALTIASRAALQQPPADFAAAPFLSPRGTLYIGRIEREQALIEALTAAQRFVPDAVRLDAAETLRLCPVLRPEGLAGAVYEAAAMDIDVHALHQAFLRGLTRCGGRLLRNAEVTRLERVRDRWQVQAGAHRIEARSVVNAAGAWADEVARLATGGRALGIVPLRRTAFTFDAPPGDSSAAWPCVIDVDEQFYFKPDAGRLLGSLADETPQAPADAQPEALDVATAVDRIEAATTMSISRVRSQWAGLRSFAPDRSPVIGRDPVLEEFYWLAGQGGYGIMTSPACAAAIAGILRSGALPPTLAALGLRLEQLSPVRFGA